MQWRREKPATRPGLGQIIMAHKEDPLARWPPCNNISINNSPPPPPPTSSDDEDDDENEQRRRRRPLLLACSVVRWSWISVLFSLMCCNLLWVAPTTADYAPEARTIGINYGRVANNLPSGTESVKLMQTLGVGRARIFDFDGPTIKAFAGSGLELIIGMGNSAISALAVDVNAADQWIVTNVVPYYPSSNITYIMVGNELFADSSLSSVWLQLVPAIQNLYTSLTNRNLTAIRLSTAVEYGVLSLSYPPSKGVFRTDIATQVITPLLKFLDSTGSYLFINVYPYFGWSTNSQYIPLDYALFTNSSVFYTDTTTNLQYTNLLDAQLDAMYAAMAAVGYGDVRVAISETGWPTLGDSNELGANISNAQTYNNNLVKYVLGSPTKGTPRKPGTFIPTFIFALFNENEKTGATTERNWGVLYPNGNAVYPLDIKSYSGSGSGGSGGGGGGGSGGGTSGGGTALDGGNLCNGKPSVLPLSVSFFGTLFNLRI